MLETVRSFVLSTFVLILVSLIGGLVYARVPLDFMQCEQVYRIQKEVPPMLELPTFTKKESVCVKSREDLNDFESCLAKVAIKNNFPVTSLLLAGKVTELRGVLNVTCVAVAY